MSIRIIDCKTEYAVNPLGLDCPAPRLFWKLEADQPQAVQTAYRILVATGRELLDRDEGNMWDTGKVESGESAHIRYAGAPLMSDTGYYWKVRVWDGNGNASEWGEQAMWSTGLLARAEYKGLWIGRKMEPDAYLQPSPYLRKEIRVKAGVKRATVYATALGLYELRLDGQRLSHPFAPGWTDYNVRVQVQTYDVTGMLREGAHTFGVLLGDGWYSGTVGFLGKSVYGERPFFMLQMNVEYGDGSRETFITDGSWRTARGAIEYSDMIKGETFDARKEPRGWDRPGFDDSAWESPDIRPGCNGLLTATLEPPIRITELRKPVDVRRTEAGTYIFDMGQNMVGWTEVTAQGPAGTRITLSHSEMLNPDGSLYLDNLRVACQMDHYIMDGQGLERYEPHFTFHGFRYVELIGYPGEADLDTIKGKVVHSDTPSAGKLTTSDEMVNRLYSNITWGQRGNFLSVPTDCPQRDERLGWTGDAQIFARTASYNMDVSRFFTKYMVDMTDCQQPSGAFTDVAPDAGWIRYKMWSTRLNWFAPDNAGWGDAGVVIPWTLYLMYGDRTILETHYDAMVRWVVYLESMSEGLIRPDYANYGDWLSIGADTPNDVLATAYFAYSTKLLAKIAGVLGKQQDREKYGELFDSIAEAFRNTFTDPATGRIKGDTQTVYVLALQFGLLTEAGARLAARHLAEDIKKRGDRLSTGFLGVGYLLPALSDNGYLDTAYTLLTQEAFPSWMYSIKHGATTIWERWDGWTEEKGFQTPDMNSFNHYSLGSVGEWMFRYMAGIEADPDQPGFKHAVIRPRPGGKLCSVQASYESVYGSIAVDWSLADSDNGSFRLEVSVPANTTATVYVPGTDVSSQEGTQRLEDGIYLIGSGTYVFESRLAASETAV
jgi:alpha-L-rhamnosidase